MDAVTPSAETAALARKVYAALPAKVAEARKRLGRPLTYAEKVLYAHLHNAAQEWSPGSAFLLVRDLVTARRLAEAVSGARDWNVGGLHYAPGKDKLNDYVYLNEADRAAARVLLGLGATLSVQDGPASRAVSLTALDGEILA